MGYTRKVLLGLPALCTAVAQVALLLVVAQAHAQTDRARSSPDAAKHEVPPYVWSVSPW